MSTTLKASMPTELIRSRTDPERYLEDDEEAHASREFLSIKNLDTYFNHIYEYHKQGGFWSIIYSKISNLITIAFTISFSVFLVGFINWHRVISCGKSDGECKNVVLIQNNIVKNRIFGAIVVIYTIVFILYFIWHLLNLVASLTSLATTQSFYADKLNINDELLRQLPWSSVINNIVSLQKKSIRLYHNKYLDALDITNRILRKENYIIAFINKGILDFRFPTNTASFSPTSNRNKYSFPKQKQKKSKFKPKKMKMKKKRNFKLKFNAEAEEDALLRNKEENESVASEEAELGYLGSVLEWNVRYIIFSSMFDDEMKIKDSFLVNSHGLKWKFFWFGVGNLLLTPFTLVFRIIFFFLQNAEEMHNNKTDLFSFREWSSTARLHFREFNELPHEFESRVLAAHESAVKYIDSFPAAPHKRILSELLSYISGSIVAVLLLLTFIDSSILLNIQLFDRSLVWFLAIFSALLALSRSAQNGSNGTCLDFEVLMNAIAANTHYFPAKWQHKCHSQAVRNEFMNLYQPKLNLFLHEMLSVFTTPFILMLTLPNCVERLLLFVKQYTDHIDGVGHICSYSRFDFKRFTHHSFRDSKVNNNKIGLLSPMDNRQISDISNLSSTSSNTVVSQHDNETDEKQQEEVNVNNLQLLHNKKLESSFLTFAINNPKWRSDEYQSIVLQSIMQNAVTTTNTQTYNSPSTPESNKTNKELGATFSELLQSSQSHSQYLIGYSNENIQQSTNGLFNTLQRHNGNENGNPNQNNMLSEIHESDMSPSDSSIDNEEQEEEEEYHNAPYKTLLDHQQKI